MVSGFDIQNIPIIADQILFCIIFYAEFLMVLSNIKETDLEYAALKKHYIGASLLGAEYNILISFPE